MWFGTKALRAMGQTVANSEPQRRAARFLLHAQRKDGGWGESYLSCQTKKYHNLTGALWLWRLLRIVLRSLDGALRTSFVAIQKHAAHSSVHEQHQR